MRKPLLPALVLLASAGMLALTGCSGAADPGPTQTRSAASQEPTTETPAPTSDGQSVEEACAIANETVLSLQDDVTAALTNPSDQEAVMAALETVEASLGEAAGEITNEEIAPALADLQARFASFTDQLVAVQTGTPTQEQVTAIQTAAADLQAAAEGMRQRCT